MKRSIKKCVKVGIAFFVSLVLCGAVFAQNAPNSAPENAPCRNGQFYKEPSPQREEINQFFSDYRILVKDAINACRSGDKNALASVTEKSEIFKNKFAQLSAYDEWKEFDYHRYDAISGDLNRALTSDYYVKNTNSEYDRTPQMQQVRRGAVNRPTVIVKNYYYGDCREHNPHHHDMQKGNAPYPQCPQDVPCPYKPPTEMQNRNIPQ